MTDTTNFYQLQKLSRVKNGRVRIYIDLATSFLDEIDAAVKSSDNTETRAGWIRAALRERLNNGEISISSVMALEKYYNWKEQNK